MNNYSRYPGVESVRLSSGSMPHMACMGRHPDMSVHPDISGHPDMGGHPHLIGHQDIRGHQDTVGHPDKGGLSYMSGHTDMGGHPAMTGLRGGPGQMAPHPGMGAPGPPIPQLPQPSKKKRKAKGATQPMDIPMFVGGREVLGPGPFEAGNRVMMRPGLSQPGPRGQIAATGARIGGPPPHMMGHVVMTPHGPMRITPMGMVPIGPNGEMISGPMCFDGPMPRMMMGPNGPVPAPPNQDYNPHRSEAMSPMDTNVRAYTSPRPNPVPPSAVFPDGPSQDNLHSSRPRKVSMGPPSHPGIGTNILVEPGTSHQETSFPGAPSPVHPETNNSGAPSPAHPGTSFPGAPSPAHPGSSFPGAPIPAYPGTCYPEASSPAHHGTNFPGAPSPIHPGTSFSGAPSPAHPGSNFPGSPSPAYPGSSFPGAPSPAHPGTSFPGAPSPAHPGSSFPGAFSPAHPGTSFPGASSSAHPGTSFPGFPSPAHPEASYTGVPSQAQPLQEETLGLVSTLGQDTIYPPGHPIIFNSSDPSTPPIYPCGICRKEVHENDQALMCESGCNFWYHRLCTGLTEAAFDFLTQEIYAEWGCDKCFRFKDVPLVKFKP